MIELENINQALLLLRVKDLYLKGRSVLLILYMYLSLNAFFLKKAK